MNKGEEEEEQQQEHKEQEEEQEHEQEEQGQKEEEQEEVLQRRKRSRKRSRRRRRNKKRRRKGDRTGHAIYIFFSREEMQCESNRKTITDIWQYNFHCFQCVFHLNSHSSPIILVNVNEHFDASRIFNEFLDPVLFF